MAAADHRSTAWRARCAVWVIGGLFFLGLNGCKGKSSHAPPPLPRVVVSQPVPQVVTEFLELTGNTQAVNTVQLRARVSGYLERVCFRDGQLVRKGQLLFVIQQQQYLANLQQAEGQVLAQEAQLAHAQTEYERYALLAQQKAAAQTDVDQWHYARDAARASLITARGARVLAQLNLGYTRVTAPFAGRIDRKLVDRSNLVGSGESTVLAELNQVDPIYVYFTISDHDLARLAKLVPGFPEPRALARWPLAVGLPGTEGYPYAGWLDFAANAVTSTTGSLLMRGVVRNQAGTISPGLYARVRLPLEQRPALLVAEQAIGHDQLGTYVFVIDKQTIVERRAVESGPLVGRRRAIYHGLSDKDWVVVGGLQRVAAGRRVIPQYAGSAPGQGAPGLAGR